MSKEEVFAQIMVAYTQLPENVWEYTKDAFKVVLEMLKEFDENEKRN